MSSGYVKNVAFVRHARVYNIMKEYDLVHKWAKNEGEAKKKGFDQPPPRLRMSSGIKIFHTSRFLVCFIILSA